MNTLQLNHVVHFADDVAMRRRDEHKLPDAELAELARQFNVNTCDGEDGWFDDEPMPAHVSILTEEEMFSNLFLEGEIV